MAIDRCMQRCDIERNKLHTPRNYGLSHILYYGIIYLRNDQIKKKNNFKPTEVLGMRKEKKIHIECNPKAYAWRADEKATLIERNCVDGQGFQTNLPVWMAHKSEKKNGSIWMSCLSFIFFCSMLQCRLFFLIIDPLCACLFYVCVCVLKCINAATFWF